MARIITNGKVSILIGNGDNCTCHDCVDLYGGDCYSTPVNNALDGIQKALAEYLRFTPTGRRRVKSGSYAEKSIEEVISPVIRKLCGLTEKQFNESYYSWLPMVYMMRTRYRGERTYHNYRKARWWLFLMIEKDYERAGVKFKWE